MAMNKRRLKQAKLNGNFQGWLTKKKIMKIKGNTCCWCGCECTNDFMIIGGQKQPLPHTATVEHLIPIAKGGQHNINNVAIACFECNQKKSDTDLNEWITFKNSKKVTA